MLSFFGFGKRCSRKVVKRIYFSIQLATVFFWGETNHLQLSLHIPRFLMIFRRTRMFMAFSTTLVIMQHEYLQVSQNTFLYKIWVLVHFCKPVRKRVPWMDRNQDVDNPRQAKTRKVSVPISSQMERSSGGICGGNNMVQ